MLKNSLKTNFFNPVKICFNPLGKINDSLEIDFNQKTILLITSPGMAKRGKVDLLKKILNQSKLIVWDKVSPNPEIEEIQSTLEFFSNSNFDIMIAYGGGSVIDFSKVIRAGISRQIFSVKELLKPDLSSVKACLKLG